MDYRLDHIELDCKDLGESVRFYETLFGGKPMALRQRSDGRNFCFVSISGAAPIQLGESPSETGINDYGYMADNMDQVSADLLARNAEIIREICDSSGKLTTLFVKDCNGLKMEVRLPR